MSGISDKRRMQAEPLGRRITALWLFLGTLAAVLIMLKVSDFSDDTVKISNIPPARDPNPNSAWVYKPPTPQMIAMRSKAKEPVAAEQRPPWAKHIDMSKSQFIGDRYVQKLKDGSELWYTIDPRLQKKAEEIFSKYEIPYGAAVMMDVKTGRILVMAGKSRMDPGLKAFGLCLTAWAPAASVFKLVTAGALLSENRARPFTRICYHGGSQGLKPHHLTDDKEKDTQCDTLSGAIAKSINPIMGKLAIRHLDRRTLLKYANRFGFNQDLDFVRPLAVSPAAIPKESFPRAEVAAGFWHTNLSPLHGALMAQAIANRGVMIRPRLIDLARDQKGNVLGLPKGWKKEVVTEYVARLLGKMMSMTTTVGTAMDDFYDRKGRAYIPWGKVSGKTGSLTRDEPHVNYNWFMGFAPQDKPEVAFAVLLGNPRKWRIKAATAARLLLRAYGKLRPYNPPGSLPTEKNENKQENKPQL